MSVSLASRRLARLTATALVVVAATTLQAQPRTSSLARATERDAALPAGSNAVAIPVVPARRGAALPPPVTPPALPSGAASVQPLTVRLAIGSPRAGGGSSRARQTVTRTADRIHIALGDGAEWLFEQNPIDRRRVSGYAVIHASKVIVAYSDTELRNMLGITGWTQVLTLGCEAGQASWWNSAQLLPARCRSGDGRSHLQVDSVRAGVDASLLTPPAARFPDYREIALADWLEAE